MSKKYVPYNVMVTMPSSEDAENYYAYHHQDAQSVVMGVAVFDADVLFNVDLKAKRPKYRHWKKVCKKVAQYFTNMGYPAHVQY